MDVNIINPFLNATIKVIETMAFVTPVPGKPYVVTDTLIGGDISGIIGLTGAKKGSVILSLSKEAALKIVSSMLNEKFYYINTEIRDAIGELTNVIAGDARRALAEQGYMFEAGIPTVIIGQGHEIESITSGPILAIPFKVDGYQFVVSASFEK